MESKNIIQQKEFEDVARSLDFLRVLDNKSILITGATGLIGTQLAKTILCYNRLFNRNIHVIVSGRNQNKLNMLYDNLPVRTIISDVRDKINTDFPIDYIIHCASITSSQSFVNNPVETISTAIEGTKNLLELAKEKKVKGFLYTSSLEVYGIPPKYEVTESDYGYINILSVRSSYSESKRMVECLCCAYASQYGVPVTIVRLTQTIGSGIEYSDNRVFAQFAKAVIENKDIVLNTAGKTVRSYCDICDAVRGIITVLIKGKPGEAYNIANMETAISIADLAQKVCDENPEANIKVKYNQSSYMSSFGYNPEMKISLNTQKLQELGWKPQYSLSESIKRLIEGLKEKTTNKDSI